MSNDVLVVCECEQGTLKKYSLELAAKGAELAKATGGVVQAVVVGADAQESAQQLGGYGVRRVTVLDVPALSEHYNSDGYTNVLTSFIQAQQTMVVLASASSRGRDFMPRVATRLKTGVVADCVTLAFADGTLKAQHPIYAGKALVDCTVTGSPQMALARPNAFGLPEAQDGSEIDVVVEAADAGEMRAKVKAVQSSASEEMDLTEADVIVAGGRALGSAENFKFISDLARVVSGTVGASRAAVDAGYIDHAHQVGQTGKTVNPTLYVAVGISGAIQHLAGMRTARYIVAINKDPDAPIFHEADFGIVGDLFKILPVLTQKIAEAKAQ